MSYNPIGGLPTILDLPAAGIDTNASTTTDSLDIGGARLITFQVVAITGTHQTHVITLQCSLDDSNWVNVSDATIAGVGIKSEIQISAKYIRLKVTTVEGEASTVDIIIQAK